MSDPRRYNPGPISETARLELEWKQFAHQVMVDANLMLEPEFSVNQDGYHFLRDEIAVRMRTRILTDELPPESVTRSTKVPVYEPASTWQMWKRNNRLRWYTKWWLDAWLKRWPVKTREYQVGVNVTLDLSRYRAYPEAQYRASDFRLGRAVLHHTIGSPIWDFENLTGYDYGKPGSGDEDGE